MKTGLLVIATGEKYHKFVRPLLESAEKYFVRHTPILFTDSQENYPADIVRIEDEGFPNATLHRYHIFYRNAAKLIEYDQLFYVDVDMLFVNPVEEAEIFSKGITATLHPGFVVGRFDEATQGWVSTAGTPERRKESTAYIAGNKSHTYFCGGFNGGDAKTFLRMTDMIRQNIDIDTGRGLTAIWHDESHINKYLNDTKPAKILTPSYCYPENYDGGYGWTPETYPPILLALDKRRHR